MRIVTTVSGDKTAACAHCHADWSRSYAYVSYVPTRSTLTYDSGRGLKDRQLGAVGLEGHAAIAFALALALGAAALLATATLFGAALLLGIAALVARSALSVLAADPAAGRPTLAPRRQAEQDTLLAVLLGIAALLLALTGDLGAGLSAAAGACVLGLLQLRTRFLAR